MKNIFIFTTFLIIQVLWMSGCSTTQLKLPGGASFYNATLWGNPVLTGFSYDGKALKIDSASNNEVTGLQSFNAALPGVVGSAVSATITGLKASGGIPSSVGIPSLPTATLSNQPTQ